MSGILPLHEQCRTASLRRSARGGIVRGLFAVWGGFMSVDQPTRRVIALAPMPPEKSAYALARLQPSPDSIESSLRWVHGHSPKSSGISSTSTTAMRRSPIWAMPSSAFEDISELAAIRLEDEPLWDGQAKSSRYQNFASGGWFVPDSIRGSETEGYLLRHSPQPCRGLSAVTRTPHSVYFWT
jgi:hypothetical protein